MPSRTRLAYSYGNSSWFTINGRQYNLRQDTYSKIATDVVTSNKRPWPPKKGDRSDVGGSFSAIQERIRGNASFVKAESSGLGALTYYMAGQVSPVSLSTTTFPNADVMAAGLLAAYGASGFASSIPTNPSANVANLIGESIAALNIARSIKFAKDIPKMAEEIQKTILGFRTLFRRGGSSYLSYHFGWKPFIKDLRDIFDTAQKANAAIAQYERDSGRKIRRRRLISNESTSVKVDTGLTSYGYPTDVSYLYQSPGDLSYVDRTTRRIWFSAAYIYYIPQSKASILSPEGSRLRNKLFGTDITPEVLWNMTPWTWLADYFGNVGDVLHNINAFSKDGLVAQYAYVMCKTEVSRKYTLSNVTLQSGAKFSTSLEFVTTVKQRARGNPYGFTLNPGPLSGHQLSILAALGMSKL